MKEITLCLPNLKTKKVEGSGGGLKPCVAGTPFDGNISLEPLIHSLDFGCCGGRNNTGRIVVPGRGGGVSRRVRVVDFYRRLFDIPGLAICMEYDPIRTAGLTLVFYPTIGFFSYILAPEGLQVGDIVIATISKPELNRRRFFFCCPLKYFPISSAVHALEPYPGAGACFIRAAGTRGTICSYARNGLITVQLPSGHNYYFPEDSMASQGKLCYGGFRALDNLKAGYSRRKGRRPKVRGVAMNPHDHVFGGGHRLNRRIVLGHRTRCAYSNVKRKMQEFFLIPR